ncbi:MAG: terpene cyclase/mutase family protein [Phycisphaerae bacterium]|nr:terpene cyclase/mutase family protein [Phycisphaerae bacterium]
MSRTMGIIVALAVLVAAIIVGVVALHSGPEPDSDITANTPAPMPPGGAEDAMDAEHIEQAQALLSNGLKWLLEQQTDGGWGEGLARPAYTAMAIKALVQHPDFDSQSPPVRDALATLMEYRHDDGSFQAQGKANYTTSLAVMALAAVDDPQYAGATQDAVAYLKGIQIRPGDETPDGQQITEDHPFRGGTSYGSHGRPDLSNLSMTAAAMEAADVPDDDEFWQEATIFLQRTQNRSESNDLNWVRDAPDDGGFIYAPAHRADQLATPESKAGDRGRRSYGSMTYAGFMSMLYAGVGQDDPRVRAAYDWIRRYWRLDSNPNMPHEQSHQGLYYYYHTFAKALRAWGEPVITDTDGVEHNWRHELVGALAERVNDDGSWVNEKAERWLEGDPLLATLYSVLALEEVLK